MTRHSALLLVDVQYDFPEGGALSVSGSNEILPPIIALAKSFSTIILTQDWHPAGHKSFSTSHNGKNPYDTVFGKVVPKFSGRNTAFRIHMVPNFILRF